MSPSTLRAVPSDSELAERLSDAAERIRASLSVRIVGLQDVIEQTLITLFSRNHALLEGVPGLAKTLLLSSLSELVDCSFSRIQFTPDLMPSDVTGSEYLVNDADTGERHFKFAKGPVFANIVLADEINRAPPKTQAALMEAMEEGTVTSLGQTFALEDPFIVLATQNPIEQEGTYPLPRAQLDRFLFKVHLDYPTVEQEARIARLTTAAEPAPLEPILDRATYRALADGIGSADVPNAVLRYAVALAQASRPGADSAPGLVREYVQWGAGPRAAQALVNGARARALLQGRTRATVDDVRTLVPAVFRHRVVLTYAAEADALDEDAIIQALLARVPAPGRQAERSRPSWLRRFWLALVQPPERRRSA